MSAGGPRGGEGRRGGGHGAPPPAPPWGHGDAPTPRPLGSTAGTRSPALPRGVPGSREAPWVMPRDLEGLNKLMWQDRFIRVSMETCDCGKEFLGAAVTGEKVVGVPSSGPRRADAKAGRRRRSSRRPRWSGGQSRAWPATRLQGGWARSD